MSGSIFHIGYHKTGSTWLQNRVYPHIEGYAQIKRKLIREAVMLDRAFHFDANRSRKLLQEAAAGKNLLISEEYLSGLYHYAGLYDYGSAEIGRRLCQIDPEATVIVVIRNQADMAAAMYQHYVQEGGTHKPRRYLFPEKYRKDYQRAPYKTPVFSIRYLEYLGLLRHYRDLFGPDRLQVYLFEQFQEDPRQFVETHLQDLGLVYDGPDINYSVVNQGLSYFPLQFLRALNRFSYRSVLDKQYFVNIIPNKLRRQLGALANRVLPRMGGTSGLISDALRDEINEVFRDSNTRLAEEFNLPLEKYGYPTAERGQIQPGG